MSKRFRVDLTVTALLGYTVEADNQVAAIQVAGAAVEKQFGNALSSILEVKDIYIKEKEPNAGQS